EFQSSSSCFMSSSFTFSCISKGSHQKPRLSESRAWDRPALQCPVAHLLQTLKQQKNSTGLPKPLKRTVRNVCRQALLGDRYELENLHPPVAGDSAGARGRQGGARYPQSAASACTAGAPHLDRRDQAFGRPGTGAGRGGSDAWTGQPRDGA